MNPNTDRLMAWAQIGFSVLIFVLVGALMLIFETGHAHLTPDDLKAFDRHVDWLKDAALMVLVFWFQRSRQGGIPDASQALVTQTHTAPDGSKVVITSPAASTKVVAAPLAQTPPKESL